MSSIDLALVMDELAERLRKIPDLTTVYARPPDSVTVPSAVVAYPDSLDFDATYGRGMDRMSLPVVLVVGKPSTAAAREKLAKFCNATGPSSVKEVLESGVYSTFDDLRVTSVDFDVITVGTSDYLAAAFNLDIAGQGS